MFPEPVVTSISTAPFTARVRSKCPSTAALAGAAPIAETSARASVAPANCKLLIMCIHLSRLNWAALRYAEMPRIVQTCGVSNREHERRGKWDLRKAADAARNSPKNRSLEKGILEKCCGFGFAD